ncbi:hypothetical protein EJ08DRAFT_523590 [Tothia fuscella]|uniref:Secreted protein n=1 Tax=Tothia fuscella TaxID=1048955 RepID=A0A9P4NGP4_9PEZI|nr:hypothetical protein EJ08DRAFT_523590 [Tothia fuscella]
MCNRAILLHMLLKVGFPGTIEAVQLRRVMSIHAHAPGTAPPYPILLGKSYAFKGRSTTQASVGSVAFTSISDVYSRLGFHFRLWNHSLQPLRHHINLIHICECSRGQNWQNRTYCTPYKVIFEPPYEASRPPNERMEN